MANDGDFEAAEQAVRRGTALIEERKLLTPGLPGPFLEELAHFADPGSMTFRVVMAVAAKQWRWTSARDTQHQHDTVIDVLTDSSLVTVRGDHFQFVSSAVFNYLRASYVLRHYRAAGFTRPLKLRTHLRPKSPWSERNKEFALFLVRLLWPYAQKAVSQRLSAEVRTGRRPEDVWLAMVDILNSVDSPAAINELVGIIRFPRRRMTPDRQFAAVIELRKRNQRLGVENFRYMVDHPYGKPAEQMAIAKRMSAVDHDLGMVRLACHARNRRFNGTLRAEAALEVGDLSLWRELICDKRMPDGDRLSLLEPFLERDQAEALTTVDSFETSVRKVSTLLEIATLIAAPAPVKAGHLAEVVVLHPNRIDSRTRWRGILLVEQIAPDRLERLLDRFAQVVTCRR